MLDELGIVKVSIGIFFNCLIDWDFSNRLAQFKIESQVIETTL